LNLLKNYIALATAEAFSKLVTFAAFMYLARVLGPGTFGYIEFAAAALMCASLIVDQGFSAFGAREIAKTPLETGRLATEIVTVRFLLAAAGYLAIVLFALLINRGPIIMRLLLIYGLSLWALPFLLQWVFQGHERMHLVAIAQIIRQTVFAATVFGFVRGQQQVLMVAWAEVAGVVSAAAFCVYMYRRHFRGTARLRPAVSTQLFHEGVPIGLSQMFWVIKMFGGTLILGLITSSQNVALFAGAQRVLVALHTFVWLYYFNLLPSLARAWQQEDGEFSRLIEKSMHGMAWVAVAGGLAWAALSNQAMKLIYGPEFAAGGSVLALLAGVWAMALISGHFRFGLMAAGHSRAEMTTSALGAVLAVILIPIGYLIAGLNGAATALVIVEAGIWFSSWWCARNLLSLRGNARHLQRPLIAILLVVGVRSLLPLGAEGARLALVMLLPAMLALALEHTARVRVRQLLRLGRT
jgi:O-antigen/teichoic acid export membrane protein